MAKADIKMPEEFLLKLSNLGNKTDQIISEVLKAGGQVVLPKMKANLKSSIGKNLRFEGRSTGELVSSLGISPASIDKKGTHNVKVGFNEPRKHQTKAKKGRSYYTATNAMIANVIEYGKSGQSPKPFLKPTKSATKESSQKAMEAKFEEEVSKL